MQKRKKLNLSVKADLQRWLLLKIGVAIVISVGIALAILYAFSHKELGDSLYHAHFTIKHVSDLLLPVILVAGGVCLLTGFFIVIFLPQKIAGPLYRVEEDLKYIASTGDLRKKISLRKGDKFFHSLADAANKLVERVRKDYQDIQDKIDQAQKAIKEGRNEEALKLLSQIKENLKQKS
ncbi:methyl-accepting chemotaxis protein [Thermodesulfatator atlanticus]|uniref:hypothetical protein n=1 Tax=Thermodesulfatator atlanticus TaxID=501497 RepID=UPI0003B2E47E|nr:hypothetical protein [Thermodesulfatator atlanticus]